MNKGIIFFFLLTTNTFLFGQTKVELKKQKNDIEKEIKYTASLLEKTRKNKEKSLSYLRVLQKQIKNQENLLEALALEIKIIDIQIKKAEKDIFNTEHLIKKEEKNLIKLKLEYEKMIYAAFKKKDARNDLIFIVSAQDFNQAYRRLIYLKQYSSFRKNQADRIIKSQSKLESHKTDLSQKKEQLLLTYDSKKHLLVGNKTELDKINVAKQEKTQLIKKLTISTQGFKDKINKKQKLAQELEFKLRKIIEEEVRISRERNSKNKHSLTPETMQLTSDFSKNKGRLPWPLEKGIIVGEYGLQKHAGLPGIEVFNNGIDIATDKESVVRTVFDGVVSRIFFITGYGKAVLINHGEYFSVYSGLSEVTVKVGDKLFSKEKIGVVLTQEADQKTELHFEIWKKYTKENPSKWLYKGY